MSYIILSGFGTRIYGSLVNEIFSPTDTVFFPSNSTYVNSAADFIYYPNSNNIIINGTPVLYYTAPGYTSITGENNALYFTTSANTTGTKLAYANGATVNLTSSAVDIPGHYLTVENPAYYMVYSKHTPWTNESSPDEPVDNLKSIYDFNSEMMIGKKIKITDFAYMIRNVPWTANTVYAYFDDTANNLSNSDFYVINSSNNIYKCLSNYKNNKSTVEPVQVSTDSFTTADGYKWKYMYTLSAANNAKFSANGFIPVDANVVVSAAAVNGSIEYVHVTTSGNGYTAYVQSGVIQQVVSNNTFKVADSATSTTNGFYTSSAFYIKGGPGVGQLTVVSNYVVNTSGHYIITANSLSSISTTSEYTIRPQIKFYGDGVGLKAIPVINTTNYSIDSVDILNKGYNYSFADATVVTSPEAVTTPAVLRPVTSPRGGHGYNPYAELQSYATAISVSIANTEGNTIPTSLTFRKLGLIVDPKVYGNSQIRYVGNTFNSMTKLDITSGPTPFVNNEIVTGLVSNARARVVSSNSTSMYVTMIDGSFSFSSGNGTIAVQITNPGSGYQANANVGISGGVYTNAATVSAGAAKANSSGRITSVVLDYAGNNYTVEPTISISGNNYIPLYGNTTGILNSNGTSNGFIVVGSTIDTIANNDVVLYIVPTGNTAVSGLTNATPYFVANTIPYLAGSPTLVGALQLTSTYGGSPINITTSNTTPQLHFLKGTDATAISVLTANEYIIGANTAATASVTGINSPDIDKFSGEILFYDYIQPITRSDTTTEVAKFILIV